MKSSRSVVFTTVLVTAVIFFGLGWLLAKNSRVLQEQSVGGDSTTSASITSSATALLPIDNLDEVWKLLQSSYYDAVKLDLNVLKQAAVKGFVQGLNDPYTVFMTPAESQDFENGLEGELQGIGAELEAKNGMPIIARILKDSPAEKAGVKPGDVILKIDGVMTRGQTLRQVVGKIRGKKGTQVTVTLQRVDTVLPFDITITRNDIVLENVILKKLESGIFLITINQFNDHTKGAFDGFVQQILLEKAQGLIIDVRDNGGGYLDTAIEVISHFVAGQKPAVIIKERDTSKNKTIKTSGHAELSEIPMVVLVNGNSASASEILAGALQDYRRALILGEKSYGKGSVQEITNFNDGSSLRMTIAKWFTPLNRSIDQIGITPDQEVTFTDDDAAKKIDPQLDAAVKYLKQAKVGAGGSF